MVAEMANCGSACQLEEGDGDIPVPESKDNQTESDSSSSENNGTSSDEEEEDEDEGADSRDSAEKNEENEDPEETETQPSKNGEAVGTELGVVNGKDEMSFKLCCEKCKGAQQSHGYEPVTPRLLSKGRLQVQLEGEGTYECTVTGLVFETSEQVLVRYSILSWSKFGSFLLDGWRFAGPIFNVDTVNKDASILKSIQFPHSLCLSDPDNEMRFGVLHIKGNRPLIEPTSDHSGSHVKWNVTSLSPVGPIVQTSQAVEHHGVVLVYRQLANDAHHYSFHVYLATNSSSDIKDVAKQVRGYKNRYFPITKPPTCKLDEGTYRLLSEPEGEIKPQDLKFTLAVTKMKGYFEAFFEQPPPFKLSLIEVDTEETVWSATIREGDCVDNSEKKPRKRTYSRQRSSSPSEEEILGKRPRWLDESDGGRTGTPSAASDLSEKQLLQVAKQLGSEWWQVALHLDLSSKDLEDIKTEADVTKQKWKMLVEWKKRRKPGEATAEHLLESLKDLDVLTNEFHQTLEDLINNQSTK